jgi:hypothetical protein
MDAGIAALVAGFAGAVGSGLGAAAAFRGALQQTRAQMQSMSLQLAGQRDDAVWRIRRETLANFLGAAHRFRGHWGAALVAMEQGAAWQEHVDALKQARLELLHALDLIRLDGVPELAGAADGLVDTLIAQYDALALSSDSAIRDPASAARQLMERRRVESADAVASFTRLASTHLSASLPPRADQLR